MVNEWPPPWHHHQRPCAFVGQKERGDKKSAECVCLSGNPIHLGQSSSRFFLFFFLSWSCQIIISPGSISIPTIDGDRRRFSHTAHSLEASFSLRKLILPVDTSIQRKRESPILWNVPLEALSLSLELSLSNVCIFWPNHSSGCPLQFTWLSLPFDGPKSERGILPKKVSHTHIVIGRYIAFKMPLSPVCQCVWSTFPLLPVPLYSLSSPSFTLRSLWRNYIS